METQTKHTPEDARNTICAPWSAAQSPFAKYGTDTEEDWDISGTWYEENGETRSVAIGKVYDTSGTIAHLAAGAPALLAALEAIRDTLDEPSGADVLAHIEYLARAAIEQAHATP